MIVGAFRKNQKGKCHGLHYILSIYGNMSINEKRTAEKSVAHKFIIKLAIQITCNVRYFFHCVLIFYSRQFVRVKTANRRINLCYIDMMK